MGLFNWGRQDPISPQDPPAGQPESAPPPPNTSADGAAPGPRDAAGFEAAPGQWGAPEPGAAQDRSDAAETGAATSQWGAPESTAAPDGSDAAERGAGPDRSMTADGGAGPGPGDDRGPDRPADPQGEGADAGYRLDPPGEAPTAPVTAHPYSAPAESPTVSYQAPYAASPYASPYPNPYSQAGYQQQQAGYPQQTGYPQQAGYLQAQYPYQAPGTYRPYPSPGQHGQPGPGYPPGAYPPAGYPGGPGAPGGAPRPSSGSGGRVAKVAGISVAAVILALCSGLAGGLAANVYGDQAPSRTVTRAAAPQVDRSSVAGVAEAILPSVVDISTGQGEGSGVVLSSDGAIITNNHVLAGATGALQVTFSDGKTARATIVGTDPAGDLAVIKAQGVSGLSAAKFGDSNAARVGDTVLAIGSPLGLQGSVTQGIVSALHRTIEEPTDAGGGRRSIGDAIQTDAAINPGNSGGALVNTAGEVIGINTAIVTAGQGAGNIGVGFAISSNKAKAAADQLLKGEKVSHPYMGIQVTNGSGGALIADVVADGPAAKAGLQRGDVVTRAGSQTINDSSGLVAAIQAGKAGDRLELTVQRGGAEQRITVTLGDAP
ncbi:MAG TPA: trypsin-like peptidase domain-containing protein [Micromonosporaceae bacterium]|nr:trypsin-like peptidase domain-containing protein [Micromonosporaceae bacterium]